MKGMVLLCVIVKVIHVRCESELTSNDNNIVQGIAAKIGFPPTVLKVFVKGDIQQEEIEKLLSLCTSEDKVPSDSDVTRNRRNSIADYIGKLYSYNNLFRPYRSIFRGFKQSQTTKTPWLKKFLHGAQVEPKTESFWGIAMGAHTFSPFLRPLAQTRMPYHRIRNKQRIDELLGITRNLKHVLAEHYETEPYQWINNQKRLDDMIGRGKGKETTAAMDQNESATTRKAFHRAPLDVAGLRNTSLFPHLHATTTKRRLKFCEKQCADESEEARSKRPGSTGKTQQISPGQPKSTSTDGRTITENGSADECATTEKCTCTTECGEDYLCDGAEAQSTCKGLNKDVSAVTKNVAQTKLATTKFTKYTRSKDRKTAGPVWTLPPNSVLDQAKTPQEQRRTWYETKVTPEDRPGLTDEYKSTNEYRTTSLPSYRPSSFETADHIVTEESREYPSTCKHGNPTKQMLCIPMPIPTRIRIPNCPIKRRSTKRCTRKTTLQQGEDKFSSHPHLCDCQSEKPPSEEVPISVGDSLEDNKKPCESNKGKPQKIIVRISSALGEVPVVIMRDNGVSGVSLSLVNDYLLDGNNRLIKCLGQKPLKGRIDLNTQNSSAKHVLHSNGHKSKHFFPHLIRQQLHAGLQPKRYSFRVNYKPSHRLVSGPRASLRKGNMIRIPNPALNQDGYSGSGISNELPSYNLNSPEFLINGLDPFGLQYPALPNPRNYLPFKMNPAGAGLEPVGQPIPHINLDGFSGISPKEYPRFKIHPGIGPGRVSLPRLEPLGLRLQPAFPHQIADASQFMGYRSPILPLFYPNKNEAQSQKYLIGGLQ